VTRPPGHHRPGTEDVPGAIVGKALLVAGRIQVEGVHLPLEDHHHLRGRLTSADDDLAPGVERHVHLRGNARMRSGVQQVEGGLIQVQPRHGLHVHTPCKEPHAILTAEVGGSHSTFAAVGDGSPLTLPGPGWPTRAA